MRKPIAAILWLLAAAPAYAETMYVSDRLQTTLRAALAEGSPVVKTLESGAVLEVLERADRFARVRDAQGAEGWIDVRVLVATAPARTQLERAQADLAKARADLAAAQAQISQLETKLSQAAPRSDAEPRKAETVPSATLQAPSVDDEDFPWGWLVLAFAMLWLGFGAGIVWLRERHRKKLGGMYLRV